MIVVLFLWQMYDDSFVKNFCASDASEDCFNRFYTIVRFCVWIIGLFGTYIQSISYGKSFVCIILREMMHL